MKKILLALVVCSSPFYLFAVEKLSIKCGGNPNNWMISIEGGSSSGSTPNFDYRTPSNEEKIYSSLAYSSKYPDGSVEFHAANGTNLKVYESKCIDDDSGQATSYTGVFNVIEDEDTPGAFTYSGCCTSVKGL